MEQDLMRRRAAELSTALGVGIELFSSTEGIDDMGLVTSLRTGVTGGWYDPSSSSVRIYVPSLNGRVGSLDASVVYHLVAGKGIRAACGDSYGDLCTKVYRALGTDPDDGISVMRQQARGDRILRSLGPKDLAAWNRVVSCFCEVKGLEESYGIGSSLRAGEMAFRSETVRKAREAGDWHAVDKYVARSLEGAGAPQYFDIGPVSEPYRRVGYPAYSLSLQTSQVQRMLEQCGKGTGDIIGMSLVARLHEPMALVYGKPTGDGSPRNVIAVTSVKLEGEREGYLSLVLRQPDDVRRVCAGKENPFLTAGAFTVLSEWSLATALSKADNILYLRPKEGRGFMYEVEDVIRGMMGKDASDLHIKGDAASLQPLSADRISRRLNDAANVVTSFRNPMSEDRYVEIFGRTREEMQKSRRMEDMVLDGSRALEQAPVTVPAPSFRKRLSTPVSEKFFSKATCAAMLKAGVVDAQQVISCGEKRLREQFGPKSVKDAVKFLASVNLSFNISRKHHVAVTEEALAQMDGEGRRVAMAREFCRSVEDVPEGEDCTGLSMPRSGVGDYFSGTDALYLVAKMASFTRWEGCNVFLTREEVARHGLTLQEAAEPCHIGIFGDSATVYNLADTTLPLKERGLFEGILEQSRTQSVPVPAYLSNLIPLVKGPSTDACLSYCSHLESVYRRYVPASSLGRKPEALSRVMARERREAAQRQRQTPPGKGIERKLKH